MNSKGLLAADCAIAVAALLCATSGSARAAPLTPGNILVNDVVFGPGGRLREFTASGNLVQTFLVPSPGGTESPRDITVARKGNVKIYNGLLAPC